MTAASEAGAGLRLQGGQRETAARLSETEARHNRPRIVAARQPEPVLAPAYRTLHSAEDERTLRRSAEQRRQKTANAVSQIDAWLDRRPG